LTSSDEAQGPEPPLVTAVRAPDVEAALTFYRDALDPAGHPWAQPR